MKFDVQVGIIGKKDMWTESYERDIDDPEAWAQETVERFNSNLRPWESAREVIKVIVTDARPPSPHTWEEDYTIQLVRNVAVARKFRCADCGIIGYAVDVGSRIMPDYPYRAPVFDRCDTAQKFLKERSTE